MNKILSDTNNGLFIHLTCILHAYILAKFWGVVGTHEEDMFLFSWMGWSGGVGTLTNEVKITL